MSESVEHDGLTEPTAALSESEHRLSFPVVGIGASAGGIEALEKFFRALPADSGVAVVLIQHLSTVWPTELAAIIQRWTKTPVLYVDEEMPVEIDHIYILPPGTILTIQEGVLHPISKDRASGHPTVIDQFFRSLAEDQGENAIGIVLSGMGVDGTLGLKALKELGGLTLVQSPQEAMHNGMPISAIQTDLIDLVGTVPELVDALLTHVQQSAEPQEVSQPDSTESSEEFLAVLAQIRQLTGHNFRSYKRATLQRRLTRRMQLSHKQTMVQYLRYLAEFPEEAHRLFKDFLITVTNFFRDPDSFHLLAEKVIPQMFKRKNNEQPVRVWVAGCATGEEAYTIAMLLWEEAERLESAAEFQIFATDVDQDALAVARQGFYPESIAADLSAERLRRFFVATQGGYRVIPELRERILFTPHNLLEDPPFSRLDMISCRNLLIYINRDVQQWLWELFHYALQPQGFLLLGSSETIDINSTPLFTDYNKRHRLYQRRVGEGSPLSMHSLRSESEVKSLTTSKPMAISTQSLESMYQSWRLKRYAPPSLLVDEQYNIVHIFSGAGKFLQEQDGPINYNVLQKVLPELRLDLRTALYQAFHHRVQTTSRLLRVEIDDSEQMVRMHVGPVEEPGFPHGYAEVVFELLERVSGSQGEQSSQSTDNPLVGQLEEEIQRTRERLQATVEEYETSNEELRASNEELQSMNEELRSTTEELETSKEELQSVNEELIAVNQELQVNIEEVSRVNTDLQNLMASTDIPTIFLDRTLSIKLFTPCTTEIFNILKADIGRPFHHLSHRLNYENLNEDAQQVLKELTAFEREIRSKNGKWYFTHIFPYRTLEDKIDGVIMTFVDVTSLKEAERTIAQRAHQQSTVADLGQLALEGLELDRLFQQVVQRVSKVLDMEMCKVLELQDEHQLLLKSGVGWAEGLVGNASVSTGKESQAGYTLHTGGPVVVTDLVNEKRFQGPDLLLNHNVISGLSVVIRGSRRAYGVLGVHSARPRTFSEDDINFVQSVANVLAQAIEQRHAQDALAQANAELEQRVQARTQELLDANTQLRAEVVARQQAQERFSTAFNVNPAASAIASMDTLRYTHVNASFEMLTGYSEDEIIGKTAEELNLVVDASATEPAITRLRNGKSLTLTEYQIRTKEGELRDIIAAAEPVEVDGKPCILAMLIDITKRKEIETALRQSQNLLAEAEQIAHSGSWAWDIQHNSLHWSAELYRIYGIDPNKFEASYEGFLNLVHPDDRAMCHEQVQRAFDTGTSFGFVHRIVRADGEIRMLRARGKVVTDEKGQPLRMLGTGQDITEQQRMENALRANEQRLRMAIEASEVGIYDLETTFAGSGYVSERWAEIFGYHLEELPPIHKLNEWLAQQIHPDDLEAMTNTYADFVAGKVPSYSAEMRVRHKSGRWIHVRSLASAIRRDEEGRVCHYVGVLQDISEQKEREDELRAHQEHLQEMVEERTADLEIKAQELMAEVSERKRAESQLLALNETLEDRVKERTQQVLELASALTLTEQRERQRIAGILHDHLQQVLYALLFRTQLFQQSTPEQRLSLMPQFRDLVQDAIATTRTLTVDLSPPILAGEGLVEAISWLSEQMREIHHLRIELLVKEKPPVLKEEMRILLFQLVRELMFNVVKHAGVNKAQVLIGHSGSNLYITVADEGQGFNAKAAYEKKESESGWGLFSIRERLSLFGGQLKIESTPQEGSRVTILFPLYDQLQETTNESE